MLAKRIFYGSIFGAIVILFLMFETVGLLALIFVLGNICVYEINNAFKHKGIKSSPIIGYVFMVLLIPSYILFKDVGIFILLGLCIYLNFCYFILRQKVDEEMLYSSLQLIYPCFLVSFICPILFVKKDLGFGLSIFISVILNCVLTDIFAYFAGMNLGKHKLCPKISPKKTVEGAIGGFFGSVASSIIMYFVWLIIFRVQIPFSFMLTLGLVCGVFAQFGDLTASMIKRMCGIKDFGNILPGHGGIMDRIDSVIFCVPVCYVLLFAFKMLGGI